MAKKKQIKKQAGPLMVPAYLSVRATGGAVASSPLIKKNIFFVVKICFYPLKSLPLQRKNGTGSARSPLFLSTFLFYCLLTC